MRKSAGLWSMYVLGQFGVIPRNKSNWIGEAFMSALIVAMIIAKVRGMKLKDVRDSLQQVRGAIVRGSALVNPGEVLRSLNTFEKTNIIPVMGINDAVDVLSQISPDELGSIIRFVENDVDRLKKIRDAFKTKGVGPDLKIAIEKNHEALARSEEYLAVLKDAANRGNATAIDFAEQKATRLLTKGEISITKLADTHVPKKNNIPSVLSKDFFQRHPLINDPNKPLLTPVDIEKYAVMAKDASALVSPPRKPVPPRWDQKLFNWLKSVRQVRVH